MKKLIVFVILLIPSIVWAAAGTITCTDYSYVGVSGKRDIRFITYTITAGSGAESFANLAMNEVEITANNWPSNRKISLEGWWLFGVDTLFGATGPTDNTDLYLWRSYGEDKIDVLGGEGVNAIDNATNNRIYPATSSQPLIGTEILDMDNNAVNDAVITVVFILCR